VQGSKGASNEFAIAVILVQFKKRGFQFNKNFAGFFLKSLLMSVNRAACR
jgi:hypothetical protein